MCCECRAYWFSSNTVLCAFHRGAWSVSLLEAHTIHSVFDSSTGKRIIVKREYHCITDHKSHTWDATQIFLTDIHGDMQKHGDFSIRREMTDGAIDFKSKSPLVSVGLSWALNKFARENNQTLPGKGKGECDRTGGHFGGFVKIIMKMVDAASRTGIARPSNARDLYNLLRSHTSFLKPVVRPGLTVFKILLFADQSDFPDPHDLVQGLSGFKGTRSHFCYATPPENKDLDMEWPMYRGKGEVDLLFRRLTCGCDLCGNCDYDRCLRKETVGVMQR